MQPRIDSIMHPAIDTPDGFPTYGKPLLSKTTPVHNMFVSIVNDNIIIYYCTHFSRFLDDILFNHMHY